VRKRTWDILAKFVSEEMGIKVVVNNTCPGPRIMLDTKTIELPESIKDQNALAALSTLIHEASHMKWTVELPKDLAKTNIDHYILNAMEDVRIDNKAFRILPNVQDFYLKFVKDHLCTKENKAKILKQHLLTRCMIQAILDRTGFSRYCFDDVAVKFMYDNDVWSPFQTGIWSIDNADWKEVAKAIQEVKSKFNIPKDMEQEQPQGGGKGEGDPNSKGKGASGNQPPGSVGCGGQGDGASQETPRTGESNTGQIEDPQNFLNPTSVWEKGDGLKGPGGLEFNPIELAEITKQRFIETLNIKERYTQNDGSKLDTDNLLAYYTGDVDELFIEEVSHKVKKSKIVFCLDASGSMSTRLFDRTDRKETLGKCIKSLTNILDEVKETEGLNVDYDVIAFHSHPVLLDKATWEEDFMRQSGGTDIPPAIEMAIKLLQDDEIDGNRIIILVTDGDVYSGDIDEVKRLMLENTDIKAMLLGIGAKSKYIEKLCGDNNIICLEHADQIVMECVQEMLETY